MKENDLIKTNNITFEDIKHIDEDGNEYWIASELQLLFGYKKWSAFEKVIERSINACMVSGFSVKNNFVILNDGSLIGNDEVSEAYDYKLSRYASYLIIQNANPKYKNVALAKSYIAFKTRKMEVYDNKYNSSGKSNHSNNYDTKLSWINDNTDKGVSLEDATNAFIMTLAEQKVKKENITDKDKIVSIYLEVDKAVREMF